MNIDYIPYLKDKYKKQLSDYVNSYIHEYVMDNSSLSKCRCNIKREYGYQIKLN